jgi:predicted dehydrogenase
LVVTEQGKGRRVVKPAGSDGYGEEIRYMIEAIQSGKAPKIVTAQDGLSAVEICEAEAKSVKTGRVVTVGGR